MSGQYALMTSTQGAIMTETAHLMVLEAQEKLGALLETLGLCNVCCCQATGISQAIQPAILHVQPRRDEMKASLCIREMSNPNPDACAC